MKKKLAGSFLLTVVMIMYSFNAPAQWQQIGALYGEPVYSVRANSSTIYALTLAGAYRSDNNGGSWNLIPQLFLQNVVERVSVTGDTVLVFAQPDSYVSLNNGTTWNELTPPSGNVFPSCVDAGGGKLYMGTSGDYLYTSTTGGNSWTQVTSGLTTGEISCISTEGPAVFVGTDDGVFVSNNAGSSFSFSGLPGEYIQRVYVKSPNVFAYTGSEIYKSDDNGATWNLFQPAIGFADITDIVVSGSRVFAATNGELISSVTFAPAWQYVNLPSGVQFTNSVCVKGSELLLGCNRGVFTTMNNGSSWTEINNGIIPVAVTGLAITPGDTVYAGASIYGVSRYNGSSWEFSGLQMLNANSILHTGNNTYVAGDFGINRSSDGGQSWVFLNNTSGNPVLSFCSDVAVSGSLIIGAALQNGVLRSDDNGATWTLVNNGMPNAQIGSIIFSGSNIIAGSFNNGIYTSTDNGLTWIQTGAPGEIINDVVSIGNIVYAATNSLSGNFRSIDGGLTWAAAGGNYYDKLSTSDSIIAASFQGYVELSRDSGITFGYNTPAPAGAAIISNQITGTDLYVGTAYDGVWKITISELTGINEANQSSNPDIKLLPNIFRDEATLLVNDAVLKLQPKLRIVDITGKILHRQNITDRQTSIKATGLAKGIYFYQVYDNTKNIHTGKMVVID